MAENKKILLDISIKGASEISKTELALKRLSKERSDILKKVGKGNALTQAEIDKLGHLKSNIDATRNSLHDQTRAVLKNNNALKKNSGFVAGVRKGVGQWAKSMIGLTVAIATVTRVVGDAFRIIKDFEKANSKLAAVTRASTTEMKSMSTQAKQLGSTTAFTASQVTELQTEFAKLGFPTNDILDMTEATLAGAAALGSDLGEQAALTGAVLNSFGLEAKEAGRVNDVLAESAASSALDFAKLSTALPIVGSVAQATGRTLEETTSILGVLTSNGLDASSSATSLRNIFVKLASKGLTMEQAMAKINASTDKAKTSFDLFGKTSVAAGVILAEQGESVDALTTKLGESEGAAQEMADTMLNNLAGDIDLAKSAWEGFVISLDEGESVIGGSLRNITQGFTKLLTGLKNIDLIWKGTFSGLADFTQEELERTLSGGWETEADVNIQKVVDAFDKIPFEKMKGNAAEMQQTWIEILGEDREDAMILFNGYIQKRINLQKELNKETEKENDLESEGEGGDEDTSDTLTKAQKAAIAREKKKQEKIAADKIKLQEKTQNKIDALEIKAIEDDRDRKEAELQFEFENKLAAIEGNSEIEKELKLRLAQELEDALNTQKAEWAEEDNQNQLDAIEEANQASAEKRQEEIDTKAEFAQQDFQTQRQILALKEEQEIAAANGNAEAIRKIKERYALLNAQLDKQEFTYKVGLAEQAFSQLASLAKEGSDEQKALASAAAIVQTYLGATAAYTAGMQLGAPAGFIAAPLMAGIAIATGLANVAKINGVQFAEGGVLQGASHKEGGIPFTVDGRSGFEAEGGEAIMTKRAVEMFRPQLSEMNVAGGGVAFERGGMLTRKFAQGGSIPSSSGVLASQQNPATSSNLLELADVIVDGFNDKEVINVSTNTTDVASEVINIQSEATF